MSDSATKTLEYILNSGEYTPIPAVVMFDEHDEHDRAGKLVRKFDRVKLQQIVDCCNGLEKTTGDLTLIGPGHTRDDSRDASGKLIAVSEEDQPPVWGYARNYRLGTFGPAKKLGVLADWHIKNAIKTKNGEVVNGPEYVKTFPRRSAEIWPSDMRLDWMALLRKAPMRNLGLLAYSRDNQARELVDAGLIRSAREIHTPYFAANHHPVAAIGRDGKLRYGMDNAMADTTPVDAPDPGANQDYDVPGADIPPPGHEDFAKQLDYAFKHHPHLMQLSEMCAKPAEPEPNAKPDFTPPASPEGLNGVNRMSRNGTTTTPETDPVVLRYQKEVEELRTKQAQNDAYVAELRHKGKVERFSRVLTELQVNEDIVFDMAEELTDCEKMDDAQFERHTEKMKKNYQRSPVGHRLPHDIVVKDTSKETEADKMEKHAPAIIRYAKDHNIVGEKSFYTAYQKMKEEKLIV